ncbi:GTP-binding protein [Enhygromyxa salina]|uniref:Mutual gliding-motility protein MglA n=1 Tax=Enhygromyxa salina TaxID=215803 RepID=A0A2S9YRL7_9BACT|nr:GTPase domain-containing protein [Enhygromyxa salina]PRQ07741.1 Mutual gliding-motility protein MglA [Enhygromyxa salina]
MVYIDIQHREVTLKLVYYGPALSGKTTNLQQLHACMVGHTGGELVTLDTRDDRTLFFDLLPLEFETRGGFKIRLKLFTVPGQVIHNATRKIVLQGADGVAFIADSRVAQTRGNNESFANLKQNLRDNGLDFDDIALVIQFNKRDLPGIRSDAEVKRIATKGKEPIYTAVATEGRGVPETFKGLAALSWKKLDAKFNFADRFGVTHDDFMERIDELFAPAGSGDGGDGT